RRHDPVLHQEPGALALLVHALAQLLQVEVDRGGDLQLLLGPVRRADLHTYGLVLPDRVVGQADLRPFPREAFQQPDADAAEEFALLREGRFHHPVPFDTALKTFPIMAPPGDRRPGRLCALATRERIACTPRRYGSPGCGSGGGPRSGTASPSCCSCC